VLTDDDFADLPLPTSHAIDVLEFVPSEQVDPILYGKSYYLEPDGAATKPYVLLRDALEDSERVAIVKIALRQREQLATLRVRDGVLVMHTMLWPDEVRKAGFDFLDENVSVRPQELSMATSLIDSMTADFEPDEYTDDYREALQEVIDAKVAGREVTQQPTEEEAPSNTIDLMAALRASVDRAKTKRGETPAKAPAKKAAAKKTAKKAAPRKRAAKKSATSSTKRKTA
jgi:DNA end-binding protein Ku